MKRTNSLQSIRALRNQRLRRHFAKLQEQNPKWRYDALVAHTADHFNVSVRTVRAILNREGSYGD